LIATQGNKDSGSGMTSCCNHQVEEPYMVSALAGVRGKAGSLKDV